jgi:hypothetical protein
MTTKLIAKNPDMAMPEGLSSKAKKAYQILLKWAQKHDEYTGGCRTFYHPKEWANRGESYGTKSHLILVHDGGCFSEYNEYLGPNCQGWLEDTRDELAAIGLYAEPCTCWYTAFYEI